MLKAYQILAVIILTIWTIKSAFNTRKDMNSFIYTAFVTVTMWLTVLEV